MDHVNKKKKSGFTLVELMVVAVIVAILAAVAIPLMSANKKRAIATEAEAALGTIRSALRAQFAETGAYNKDINGNPVVAGAVTNIPGISAGDLDGRYFSEECYEFQEIGEKTYTLKADGSTAEEGGKNEAPAAEDADTILVTLDEKGKFNRSGF